ncbi:DUF4240 domain-containing protein [Shouchella miscanthi]|uniref:DUF4240 domain-containing protein n=1 Tax=Shouchella miscanthi TaxID=2598861 RepID=UPI00119CB139|nr:DUF4240 domain-containing protein [Shouchella miscanthi]
MDFNQGDVYAYQLPNGYYSVMKVLEYDVNNKRDGVLFTLTSYFDHAIPSLDDERLELPFKDYDRSVAETIDVDDLIFVGNRPLNQKEAERLLKTRGTIGGVSLFYFLIKPYVMWLDNHDPKSADLYLGELRKKEEAESEKKVNPLPSKAFWEIISLIDLEADIPLEKARDKLASMTEKQIKQFEEALAQKLYKLDTEKHARSIGEAAYVDEETFFSPDFFLYTRCLAVAKGKDFYEHVVKHPEAMPKDDECEELLTLAAEAFEEKTDDKWNYVPSKDYETFSNERGWR